MSSKHTGYALESRVGHPVRKNILFAMADSANAKTGVMWHSVESIADMAECSSRTVQRHLPILLTQGFIREGDQSYVSHLPPRNRPTVYEVAASDTAREKWAGGVAPLRQRSAKQGATRTGRGANLSPRRGDDLSPLRGDSFDGSEVTVSTFRGDRAVSPKQERTGREQKTACKAGSPLRISDLHESVQQLRAAFQATESLKGVRFSKLRPEQADLLRHLVSVHGVNRLVVEVRNTINPPSFVQAFLNDWDDLTATPLSLVADDGPRCTECAQPQRICEAQQRSYAAEDIHQFRSEAS